MKVSLKTMALVGALVCSAELVEANCMPLRGKAMDERCCGRPTGRPGVNRPKPKQTVKSVSCDEQVTKGCPCNKPKPKPPVTVTNNMKSRVAMFRSASPAQQRQQLADQVAQYMSNPCEEMAEMLMACSDAYCMRMNNQSMNRLVTELMSSSNRKAVQAKIMRTLEV